jgi:hypothetical protein
MEMGVGHEEGRWTVRMGHAANVQDGGRPGNRKWLPQQEDADLSIWDEAKKNLVDWYSVTADKTTELAKVTSRRYDKYGLSRDIERQFSELGSLVYNGLREGTEGILEAPEVEALMERIVALEKALRAKDEEIESIKRDHAARKARAAQAGGEDAGAEDSGAGTARIMVDPALSQGDPASAILVEEAADADFEDLDADEKDKDNPEKTP